MAHVPGGELPTTPRLASVDALRGIVMVIMALDHTREFFHAEAMRFRAEDLEQTTAAIFFTRWVTHICAPVFFFLAGTSAFLWRERNGRSQAELSRFLLTRGFWLMLLELTVLRFAFFFSLTNPLVLLTVLWALGLSMVGLAGLSRLPVRALAALSLAVIVLHHVLEPVDPSHFGAFAWTWRVLHDPGPFPLGNFVVVVAYPLIPWVAVMSAGCAFGAVVASTDGERRRQVAFRTGVVAVCAFVALRSVNAYGEPVPWSADAPGSALLSFLNLTKYPPSLQFLLMTLGPALMLYAWLDRQPWSRAHPLVVIGSVPLSFFLLHFLTAHLLAIPFAAVRYGRVDFLAEPMPTVGGPNPAYPADFGYSLATVYLVWVVVVALSYPICAWLARVKTRRREWWLSFV